MWQEQPSDEKLAPKGTGSGLRGTFKTAAIESPYLPLGLI